jgi:trehalose-phosphatase
LDEKKRRRAGRPPRADPRWAWFFDIDGTLVEIAPTPSSIVVHDALPHLISRLHSLTGGAVSLITGRAVSDVERFLPLPGIVVAGQHGLEMRNPEGDISVESDSGADLKSIESRLSDVAKRHTDLIVEHKGSSIALHYRQAPMLGAYAHRVMRDLRSKHAPRLMIQKGKRVVELKPAEADKGTAIKALMQTEPFRGRIPVFIGDDVTDETGFALVNGMGGHSIKVGKGRSRARWRLRDVKAVREWLSETVGSA